MMQARYINRTVALAFKPLLLCMKWWKDILNGGH